MKHDIKYYKNKTIKIGIILLLILISITSVSASERVTAEVGDNFTYYGMDTVVGSDGYYFSVEVNDTNYYIDFFSEAETVLSTYSPNFNEMFNYDLDLYGNDVEITNAFGQSVGGLRVDKDYGQIIDFEVDKKFSFTYHTGEHIGFNTNASVIDQVYDENGNRLTE